MLGQMCKYHHKGLSVVNKNLNREFNAEGDS